MSIFPQRETFSYCPETKDKYGTVTPGSTVTYSGAIERERTFASDGSVISKGTIYTVEDFEFKTDVKVVVDGVDYYINTVEKYVIPGYTYRALSYV